MNRRRRRKETQYEQDRNRFSSDMTRLHKMCQYMENQISVTQELKVLPTGKAKPMGKYVRERILSRFYDTTEIPGDKKPTRVVAYLFFSGIGSFNRALNRLANNLNEQGFHAFVESASHSSTFTTPEGIHEFFHQDQNTVHTEEGRIKHESNLRILEMVYPPDEPIGSTEMRLLLFVEALCKENRKMRKKKNSPTQTGGGGGGGGDGLFTFRNTLLFKD